MYYEDLMTDPEREIRRLVEFLDLPRDRLTELLDDLEVHKKASVRLYRQNQESYTEGDTGKLSYHSDQLLSDQEKRAFDRYYAERYRGLYEA